MTHPDNQTFIPPKVPPRKAGEDEHCQLCAVRGRPQRKSVIWLHAARQFYYCIEQGINPEYPPGCPTIGLCKSCYKRVDSESEKDEEGLRGRANIRRHFHGALFTASPPPDAA